MPQLLSTLRLFGRYDFMKSALGATYPAASAVTPLHPDQTAADLVGGTLGSGSAIAVRLDQDVEKVAVLVHGPPQILSSAVARHEDFVQIQVSPSWPRRRRGCRA